MSELEIVRVFNQFGRGTIVDGISLLVSNIILMGALWFSVAVLFLIFDKKNGKTVFVTIVLGTIIYFLINDAFFKYGLLKLLPFRERPYVADPLVLPLGMHFGDSSFPSGHMSNTVIMVTVFVYYFRRLLWPGVVLVLLMAFTRMHNGMHYPSDVLGGVVLGLGYGALAIWLGRKIAAKLWKN